VWKVAANTLPSLTTSRFRSLLLDDGSGEEGNGGDAGSTVSVFQQLSEVAEKERIDILSQSLRQKLSSMLGISVEDVEMRCALFLFSVPVPEVLLPLLTWPTARGVATSLLILVSIR